MERSWKKTAILFAIMFKLGCFTFGGGWSIIAQIQTEFIEKRSWLTEEQQTDFISLSRSFPGIMVINFVVMCGYTIGGFWGAVASAAGLSLPALIAIGIVTYFYAILQYNHYAEKILNGVRSAVIPIIFSAAWKLRAASLKKKFGYVLMTIAFVLCAFTPINKIFVIFIGVLAGIASWKRGE